MRDIATHYKVTLDAVVYFMRKYKIVRRSLKEASSKSFARKKPSFTQNSVSNRTKELKAIGTALCWAEGYKSDKANNVDFANSDP